MPNVTSLLCQVWSLGRRITNLAAGEGSHFCRAVSPLGAYVPLSHSIVINPREYVTQLLDCIFVILFTESKNLTGIYHCYMNSLNIFLKYLYFTCPDKQMALFSVGVTCSLVEV